MSRTMRRICRKPRKCERCHAAIQRGDIYLESVCSPDHDGLGNVGWWRLFECAGCARLCGREHLLGGAR